MQYDMICNDCGKRFEFRCSLKDKPTNHQQLLSKYLHGIIKPQIGETSIDIFPDDCFGKLITNWETQKPIRYNINWPKTENLK